jgi:homoserine trans-succinylase
VEKKSRRDLYITDFMPYTVKTLAIEFNRSVEEVKAAIKVLKN